MKLSPFPNTIPANHPIFHQAGTPFSWEYSTISALMTEIPTAVQHVFCADMAWFKLHIGTTFTVYTLLSTPGHKSSTFRSNLMMLLQDVYLGSVPEEDLRKTLTQQLTGVAYDGKGTQKNAAEWALWYALRRRYYHQSPGEHRSNVMCCYASCINDNHCDTTALKHFIHERLIYLCRVYSVTHRFPWIMLTEEGNSIVPEPTEFIDYHRWLSGDDGLCANKLMKREPDPL